MNRRTAATISGFALLLIVYLAPRLLGIDRMLNTDEVDWLGGAANVVIGLAHGDLRSTFQLPHPGATTLWAGAIAFVIRVPDFAALHPAPLAHIHGVHRDLRALGIDPLEMLVAARVVKLLFQAVLFLIAGWYLFRLFGRSVAWTTLLLLAFEPFAIGHDRFLHIDGLTAIAAFPATLAIGHALTRPMSANRWTTVAWWSAAGALSALAWLTRFTAGTLAVVAVGAILLIAASTLRRRTRTRPVIGRWTVTSLAAYLGMAGLVSVALWPAVLVEPVEVFDAIRAYVTNAAVTGHELPIFYDGEVVFGDPGKRFYLDVILWRATPFVLLGVLLLLIGTVAWRHHVLPVPSRAPLLVALAFALSYGVLMDAGAKKFDRYILPVFPVLDLLAAVGLVGLARLLWHRAPRGLGRLGPAIVVAVIVGQIGSAWSDRPYGTDYYDPLLGRMTRAQDHMLLGWGEGLDQAARFILAQPGGETASVRTSANDVTLLYFLPETVQVRGDGGYPHGPRGIASWARTDYYVAYTLQWQRDLDAVVLPYLATQPALETVSIDGVPFARVYDLRTTPPSPELVTELTCRWSFGDQTTLLTYSDRSIKAQQDDPNLRELALYFQSAVAGPLEVSVELVSRDGTNPTVRATGAIPASATPGVIRTALLDVELPRGGTTDYYWIDVTVMDPATGEVLSASPLSNPSDERQTASANNCADAGAVNLPF